MNMKTLVFVLALSCAAAPAATLFLGAYPDSVIVFDEGQGKIVEKIPLTTGLPTSMRLSMDRKKIYVTTNDHSGLEVIDVATRKVNNHYLLHPPVRHYHCNGGVPEPHDNDYYTFTMEMNKLKDRY